ncbi:hypothetical protein PRZ48_003076 [Zasmidium cellare]|uniref:Uncharacterized protein n=1 Tax=Zasmidium cellare TaxID=395010 RepID=A0ABR0EVB9_ZASCE|nr:hypothetical protein PRZ48_003076 [Zasmidium cellare]
MDANQSIENTRTKRKVAALARKTENLTLEGEKKKKKKCRTRTTAERRAMRKERRGAVSTHKSAQTLELPFRHQTAPKTLSNTYARASRPEGFESFIKREEKTVEYLEG